MHAKKPRLAGANGNGLKQAVTVGEAPVGDIDQSTRSPVDPPVFHAGSAPESKQEPLGLCPRLLQFAFRVGISNDATSGGEG